MKEMHSDKQEHFITQMFSRTKIEKKVSFFLRKRNFEKRIHCVNVWQYRRLHSILFLDSIEITRNLWCLLPSTQSFMLARQLNSDTSSRYSVHAAWKEPPPFPWPDPFDGLLKEQRKEEAVLTALFLASREWRAIVDSVQVLQFLDSWSSSLEQSIREDGRNQREEEGEEQQRQRRRRRNKHSKCEPRKAQCSFQVNAFRERRSSPSKPMSSLDLNSQEKDETSQLRHHKKKESKEDK